ncbi:MAG: hypothetical protein QM708_12195 [Propioniciclava sp.]|uniref:hypothetical protein n=1 Tax=Propioniciclava sp. TaxID=2038686 RepID=UPI0039E518B0
MNTRLLAAVGIAALALTACSTTTPSAAPGSGAPAAPAATSAKPAKPADATAWAELAKQGSTTKIVTITEDNDPNNLIGRPNGYKTAAVIYDSGASCDQLGTSCGGTVEVFATEAEAKARSEYTQGVLKDAPMFGTEYHTLNGAALLRITGNIKPSVATGYADAFSAA